MKHQYTIFVFFVLINVLIILPLQVYATNWTDERQVTQHTEKDQILPLLLKGSNDTFNLLWWNDDNQILQIFYSKLNKYGRTLISPMPLFQPHTNNIHLTSAIDEENNIHVAWAECNNSYCLPELYQIYYTKISDNGTVLISPKPITSSDAELYSFHPHLLYKNNNLYLVYEEFNISKDWQTRPSIIYFAKLNKTGDNIITDKQITDSSFISVEPRLFVDAENNINIVYTRRENNYGNNGDAYFTKLDNSGNILISNKLILNSTWVLNSIGDTYDNMHLFIWNDNGNYAKIDKYGNVLVQPKSVINGGYFSCCSADLDSENNINLISLLNKQRPGFFLNLAYIKMNEIGDFLEYENISATVDDSTQTFLLVKQDDDSKHLVYGRRTYVLESGSWETYYSLYYRNTLPPEPPVLYSPINNSLTNNNNITFFWSNPFGSISYKLQYSKDNLFSDANTTTINNITNSYYQQQTLLTDGTYYWRASTNNIIGESLYSEYFLFTIDTTPPQITFVSPTSDNNSVQKNNQVVVNATISDLTSIDTCLLEWNSTNEMMIKSGNNCYKIKNTIDGEVYLFKVYANDSVGNTNVSETRVFRENTKPTTTLNITPAIAYTYDNLTCENGTILDADDDSAIIINYDWNDGINWLGINSKTLTSGNTTKGQTWTCSITLNDSYETNIVYSNNITILNSPPVIEPIDNIVVNETDFIVFNISAYDPDNDAIAITYSGPGSVSGWQTTIDDAEVYLAAINASDMWSSILTNFTITVLNIPIFGNISEVNTNLDNLTVVVGNSTNLTQLNGTQIVELKEANNTIVEFMFNFSEETLNFKNITIEKQSNTSTKGSLLVKCVKVINNQTKTVYLDNIANLNSVCVKDTEIANISEISTACNGINETIVTCDSNLNDRYNCTNMGNRYKISGLLHSGILEYTPYCGDSACNNGESCSSCPSDCGTCPAQQSSSSGGGGGSGGGGSAYVPPKKTCNESWSCTDWSVCTAGTQTRTCTDLNNCNTTKNKPIESQSCVIPSKTSEEKISIPAKVPIEVSVPLGPTGFFLGLSIINWIAGIVIGIIVALVIIFRILKKKRKKKR